MRVGVTAFTVMRSPGRKISRRGLVAFVGNFDFAVDEIDRALFMVGVERKAGALFGRDLGIEPGRYHLDRRSYAERTARDDARGKPRSVIMGRSPAA